MEVNAARYNPEIDARMCRQLFLTMIQGDLVNDVGITHGCDGHRNTAPTLFPKMACFNLRTGKLLPYITWKKRGMC